MFRVNVHKSKIQRRLLFYKELMFQEIIPVLAWFVLLLDCPSLPQSKLSRSHEPRHIHHKCANSKCMRHRPHTGAHDRCHEQYNCAKLSAILRNVRPAFLCHLLHLCTRRWKALLGKDVRTTKTWMRSVFGRASDFPESPHGPCESCPRKFRPGSCHYSHSHDFDSVRTGPENIVSKFCFVSTRLESIVSELDYRARPENVVWGIHCDNNMTNLLEKYLIWTIMIRKCKNDHIMLSGGYWSLTEIEEEFVKRISIISRRRLFHVDDLSGPDLC